MDGSCVPDYFFRCSYCITLIGEDAPVYMRDDSCYCSSSCRGKGLSKLYRDLKAQQISDAAGFQVSGSLNSLPRSRSDSSIDSRSISHGDGEGNSGLLTRLGHAVFHRMLQSVAARAWGAQALRTYSSGMLWGRELTKNSSVQRIFNYLPEVDHYLDEDGDSSYNCLGYHRQNSFDRFEPFAIESY